MDWRPAAIATLILAAACCCLATGAQRRQQGPVPGKAFFLANSPLRGNARQLAITLGEAEGAGAILASEADGSLDPIGAVSLRRVQSPRSSPVAEAAGCAEVIAGYGSGRAVVVEEYSGGLCLCAVSIGDTVCIGVPPRLFAERQVSLLCSERQRAGGCTYYDAEVLNDTFRAALSSSGEHPSSSGTGSMVVIIAIAVGVSVAGLLVIAAILVYIRSKGCRKRIRVTCSSIDSKDIDIPGPSPPSRPPIRQFCPPTQTEDEVCFVFTGVQNEAILDTVPGLRDRMLAIYHKVLRACFQRNGGLELAYRDGSFMFAFSQAEFAVVAALDLQLLLLSANWPKELFNFPDFTEEWCETTTSLLYRGARVCVGIHLGQARQTITGKLVSYSGLTVRRAYKVAAACSGGQIMITSVVYNRTKALLDNNPRITLQWLGSMEQPETVWQILPSVLSGRTFLPLGTPKECWVFPGALTSLSKGATEVGTTAPHMSLTEQAKQEQKPTAEEGQQEAPANTLEQQQDKTSSRSKRGTEEGPSRLPPNPNGKPVIPPLDMARVFAYQKYYRARLFHDGSKAAP